jgi:cholesterol transport system auxiliary component
MKARAAFIALCVPIAASCGLLSPVKIETRKEVLSQIPTHLPQATTRAATLLILAPRTHPAYDTTQMAYTTEPHQIAYFAWNEWGETPAQMIQPLMVKTLQQARYFGAVLSPPYMGRYTYALRTEILELKQDFTSEPAVLQLAMRFELTRWGANEVVAAKEISLSEPMLGRTPSAGVVAANNAMVSALRQLAQFVLEKAG